MIEKLKKLYRNLYKETKSCRRELMDVSIRQRESEERDREIISRLRFIESSLHDNADYGLNTQKRDKQIIVSLTSFKERIDIVHFGLQRLLSQTMKPDMLILWLSEKNFPNGEAELPAELMLLKNRGLTIRWVEEDIKSYKKIYYSLKEFPDDIIITVDDDIIFDRNFIERMYSEHVDNPGRVIASRVHRIAIDSEGVCPYSKWEKEIAKEETREGDELFFTSGAGTLFPPGSLHKDVLNRELFNELCPTADDIWLNIMAALKGTEIINAGINRRLVEIKNDSKKLFSINIEKNDIQLRRIIDRYKNELAETVFCRKEK